MLSVGKDKSIFVAALQTRLALAPPATGAGRCCVTDAARLGGHRGPLI